MQVAETAAARPGKGMAQRLASGQLEQQVADELQRRAQQDAEARELAALGDIDGSASLPLESLVPAAPRRALPAKGPEARLFALEHNLKRNDPCPCGSGNKFKKCCYDESIGPLAGLGGQTIVGKLAEGIDESTADDRAAAAAREAAEVDAAQLAAARATISAEDEAAAIGEAVDSEAGRIAGEPTRPVGEFLGPDEPSVEEMTAEEQRFDAQPAGIGDLVIDEPPALIEDNEAVGQTVAQPEELRVAAELARAVASLPAGVDLPEPLAASADPAPSTDSGETAQTLPPGRVFASHAEEGEADLPTSERPKLQPPTG
jgi:hypothetical protein